MNASPNWGPQHPAPWPWQRSLQHRIVLTYGAVFLVVLALLMTWVGRIVYTTQRSDAEHNLALQAFLAANTLEDPLSGYDAEFAAFADWEEAETEEEDREEKQEHGAPADRRPRSIVGSPAVVRFQQIAQVYAADTGARVTILNANGTVVADSHDPPSSLASQLAQSEVQAALRGEEAHAVRIDPRSGRRTLFVAAPIRQGDRLLGFVRLAHPLDEITTAIWALLLRLVALGLLALGIASLLGVWIARRLVRPLQTLEQASLAIAAGNLDQEVPVETCDELGALARAFNTMARELGHMVAQQRLFVANASHELRTPLTNIKLRSEALLSGVDEPEVRRRYLAEIDAETERLGRLASALLDLSLLDATSRSQTGEPVDVLPAIHRAISSVQMPAAQKAITVTTNLPEPLPLLAVWPEHLEAILVNLLDNAVKYTPSGGEISLSTRVADNGVQIWVRDNGIGIPPHDLPHVFDRFYRVDKARSRRAGQGAGLGLAIVKTLVEQNGGAIQVESRPGEGTVFSLLFPIPS
jgi:signal transduction histidine kinase